ncbi:hypothetical protein HN958_03800 [Candidatus Falkowbacteria bacterium]|jgi:hypothetical protein|nr:hypothetical protein [Candidatus Falkowbacteria bacterium]MBT7007601.1 hypothetical protein [Candidatus Falkowbacteria bacterium]
MDDNGKTILKNILDRADSEDNLCVDNHQGLPDMEIVRRFWPGSVLATCDVYQMTPLEVKYKIFKTLSAARATLHGLPNFAIIFDWSDDNPEKWPKETPSN